MEKSLQQLSFSIALISLLSFTTRNADAQIPTTCFEIQSILVAACGSPEGENEMVRFIIGPNPLPLALLTVQWPNANNNFLGICQNVQTASNVAAINASINNCGLVQEPVGGVLPAGSTVMLVTSTNMNPAFNSFAGLTDTLIMLFQCAGNTSGHFKNYGTTIPLTRTLTIAFDACIDSVTYNIDSLTMQNGMIGDQDGGTVLFDFPGNATYINPGCEAPFNALYATLNADNDSICAGASVQVSATISNTNYTSFFWTGGAGTYFNAASLSTLYGTSTTFHGTDTLVFGIVGNCSDTIYDTLHIFINPCTIGIIENAFDNSISVYPNPATEQCTIKAPGFTNSVIAVYDVTGRVLLQQHFNEEATINTGLLPQGLYVVEIKNMESWSMKTKLIKD